MNTLEHFGTLGTLTIVKYLNSKCTDKTFGLTKIVLMPIVIVRMGGAGGVKTKNFVENVKIKDRDALMTKLVLKNFTVYKSPAFYDCPRPN